MLSSPHDFNQNCDKINYISYCDVSQSFLEEIGLLFPTEITIGKFMTDFSNFSKEDYQTLAEFRYALRCFLHFSENAAESAGLTLQQHQALLFIIGYPGREQVTVGELAERLQVRHHSAVGLVNRLEEQGLVERIHDRQDRRQVFIQLTDKGVGVLKGLASTHREELRHVGPDLCNMLERITSLTEGK
jgi:DNA-binding MarR family transcriptional regulator